MPSLSATSGCREQARVLDSDSVGHLVPAITHLFYDDAHLCLFHLSPGPAGNRPGRDPCPLPLPLPCLSSFYLSASSFCLSFAFWARQVLPLFDSHPLVVRLVTSSSPACLPCAVCLVPLEWIYCFHWRLQISPVRPARLRFIGPHQLRLFAFALAVMHNIRPAS